MAYGGHISVCVRAFYSMRIESTSNKKDAYEYCVYYAYKKVKNEVWWSDQCVRTCVSVVAYTGN